MKGASAVRPDIYINIYSSGWLAVLFEYHTHILVRCQQPVAVVGNGCYSLSHPLSLIM